MVSQIPQVGVLVEILSVYEYLSRPEVAIWKYAPGDSFFPHDLWPRKILLDAQNLDGDACPMIISLNLYQPGIIIYNTHGVGWFVLTEKNPWRMALSLVPYDLPKTHLVDRKLRPFPNYPYAKIQEWVHTLAARGQKLNRAYDPLKNIKIFRFWIIYFPCFFSNNRTITDIRMTQHFTVILLWILK